MFNIGLLLLKDNFIIKGAKELSFALDKLVYSLASSAYQAFLIIGNIRLTSGGVMSKIMMRLYGVISLFMIFVLAYNLLLYIIDPDKMTDNKVGGVAILKKIIIALVIIVASPTAFDTLYEACHQVLNAHVVERIVLGGYVVESEDSVDAADLNYNAANRMIVDVFTAFLYPNPTDSGSYTGSDCLEDSDNDYCKAYTSAINHGSIAPFGTMVDASKKDDTIHYSFFISTVGGVILFLFLVGYAINLAMRAGKLAILEMIAPIPALMELIPSKAGATDRWIKAVLSTFAQVFIYEAIIFGVVWLVGLVPDALNGIFDAVFQKSNSGPIVKLFARVMIIFGLLKVGKELPKYIGDILGIKIEGASVGGVLKGALAGVGAAGWLAAGTLRGGVRNFSAGMREDRGFLKSLGSAAAGIGSGFVRNAWGARNVKSFADARKLSAKTGKDVLAKRATREAYRNLHGGTFLGSVAGHLSDMKENISSSALDLVGAQSEYAKQKAKDEALTKFNSIYNDGIASIWKNDSTWSQYNSLLERAKMETVTVKDEHGNDIETNGVKVGDTIYTVSDLENLMKQRKQSLIDKSGNQEKIRDTLVQMQAFAATHQGIDGIPDIKTFDDFGVFDINGTLDESTVSAWEDKANINGLIGKSRGKLEALQRDSKYVANKAKEKQNAAKRQAMQDAEQNANKKN